MFWCGGVGVMVIGVCWKGGVVVFGCFVFCCRLVCVWLVGVCGGVVCWLE